MGEAKLAVVTKPTIILGPPSALKLVPETDMVKVENPPAPTETAISFFLRITGIEARREKNKREQEEIRKQNQKHKIHEFICGFGGSVNSLQFLLKDEDANSLIHFFHLTVRQKYPTCDQVFLFLQTYFVNVNARDENGNSILMSAMCSPMISEQIVLLLIEEGADICAQHTKTGETALMMAVRRGFHTHIMHSLFELLKPSIQLFNKNGECTLTIAMTTQSSSETFQECLKHVTDINACNADGQSPLFFARAKEHVNALVKQGARVNITDNAGNTPLHIAAMSNRHGVTASLLHHCPDLLHVRNTAGHTALDVAFPPDGVCANFIANYHSKKEAK